MPYELTANQKNHQFEVLFEVLSLFLRNNRKSFLNWVMKCDKKWILCGSRQQPAQLSSVQFSCSVVSDSLQPHESQHARPPCSSPAPRVHSDSRPSSQRCHPAISSSVIPFSSCPQSLTASESFTMSQLFA